MVEINGLHQNKSEKNSKSLMQHLEDGLMRVKLNLLRQYRIIDSTIIIQLFDQLINHLKKKNLSTVTAVSRHLNRLMISIDRKPLCENSFLMQRSLQTLEVVLTGNGGIFASWWMTPLMVKWKKSLSLTEIDCADSVSNYWNLSLLPVPSRSWFSINENKLPLVMNWQKIYCQLSTFSTVDKWINEDMVKRTENCLKMIQLMKNHQNKPETKKEQQKTLKRKKSNDLNTIEPKKNKRKYTKTVIPTPLQKSDLEIFSELMDEEETIYKMKQIRVFPTADQRHILRKWLGTYRFIYNYTKEMIIKHDSKRNFQLLRNAIVTEEGNTLMTDKKWVFETPKEIRANAIRELLTNLSAKQKKIGIPSDINFKSKKVPKQTINLPKTAYSKVDKKIRIYPRSLGELKMKTSKKEQEYAPEITECDFKLTYSRPNIWHILIPIKMKLKEMTKEPKNMCALDPNLRNLVTGVGIDGKTFQIGEGAADTLKRKTEQIAILQSKLTELKGNRLSYLKTKNMLELQYFKTKNLVTELHNKAIKYITDRYDIIILPHLKTSTLVKNNRGFNKKLFSLKHYQFRVKLENKCIELGKKMVTLSEKYTTKTCSNCGRMKNQDSSEIYHCEYCDKTMNRDVNSAINILSKSVIEKSY